MHRSLVGSEELAVANVRLSFARALCVVAFTTRKLRTGMSLQRASTTRKTINRAAGMANFSGSGHLDVDNGKALVPNVRVGSTKSEV